MKNILDNSLVMAVLALLILIPVFIVKRKNIKKKKVLLKKKLEEITLGNKFQLIRTEKVGNLLIALTDNHQLILLNLNDFTPEIINLEEVIEIKKEINYKGKEVKDVGFLLNYHSGRSKKTTLYKQYENSERDVSAAIKLATTLELYYLNKSKV